MKASVVLAAVRRQIRDETGNPRWLDPVLFNYMTDGTRQILALRPAAGFNASVGRITVTNINNGNADIQVTDDYANALMHYVCGRAFAEDAEDAANLTLAREHYALYSREMD